MATNNVKSQKSETANSKEPQQLTIANRSVTLNCLKLKRENAFERLSDDVQEKLNTFDLLSPSRQQRLIIEFNQHIYVKDFDTTDNF